MIRIPSSKGLAYRNWISFLTIAALVILSAVAVSLLRLRLDLTEDRRYTLSEPTRKILKSLKDDYYIQVYLDGEMPVPLKRLRRSLREMLDEFRIASGRKIDYQFINPSAGSNREQRDKLYQNLVDKGLIPIDVRARDEQGASTVRRIFPGMIVNHNGTEVPVNILNNSTGSYEQNILNSTEGLEYEMIQTIATLSSDTVYRVAFIEGHGELSEVETGDITMNLARFFTVDRGKISGTPGILDKYAAVVVAGPEKEFDEADKLVLDQYIMKGGKVLWLLDEVQVNSDSLAYGATVAIYRPLNIEDQLFRYGARVNPEIVQDLECMLIRMTVNSGGKQQVVSAPWVYYPLLTPAADHPISRNINKVVGKFANYIDTVGLDPAIKKKVLLSSSRYSRLLSPPVLISLKEAELAYNEKDFSKSDLPVAVLLEGIFPSVFRNRTTGSIISDRNFRIRNESVPNRMIVIADADIIRNDVRRVGLQETPLTLGQDRYTGQIFGNRDFLINCLNYLVDDRGIMELRSRELKLRLLDKNMIKNGRLKWEIINITAPVLMVILAGIIYNYFRRRKYTRV